MAHHDHHESEREPEEEEEVEDQEAPVHSEHPVHALDVDVAADFLEAEPADMPPKVKNDEVQSEHEHEPQHPDGRDVGGAGGRPPSPAEHLSHEPAHLQVSDPGVDQHTGVEPAEEQEQEHVAGLEPDPRHKHSVDAGEDEDGEVDRELGVFDSRVEVLFMDVDGDVGVELEREDHGGRDGRDHEEERGQSRVFGVVVRQFSV